MSGIVPDKQLDAINFFLSRIGIWGSNSTQIGVTNIQVTNLAALVQNAQNAYNAAEIARNASKAATQALVDAMRDMRDYGGEMIKLIRTNAEITDNPNVYILANIPPVAPPTPLGPPASPSDLVASLLSSGSVQLKWKGNRAGGTSFRIYRSLKQPGTEPEAFELIGTSEERSFVDSGLPTGLQNATYYIVAIRAGGTSQPSASSAIYFGTGEGNPLEARKPDIHLAA